VPPEIQDHSRRTAVVVFTRDLRVHDHPGLAAAVRDADAVVPAFVLDDAILGSRFAAPNRLGFLAEALADLDASLRDRGAALVVRRGDWVDEVVRLVHDTGGDVVHVAADVSGYARRRSTRLAETLHALGVTVESHDGITVVPPGAVLPDGRDHYAVFTPYHRQWQAVPWRSVVPTPKAIDLPGGIAPGAVPSIRALTGGHRAPAVVRGGEREARARLNRWVRAHLAEYPDRHDDLPGDATSHLSAYLHFGCISPLEVATRLRGRAGADALLRQLAWRDFYHQALAARPDAAWSDYRGSSGWETDDEAFAAWREGRTGFPVVDAGMRQLLQEGWMHNRARLVTASFLTKDLHLDWRRGARHFLDHLVDGDLANNNLNWQWVAGTGNDTSRHRVFNPTRQGQRFDADGDYVRRYVPELASIEGRAVHDPGPLDRDACGYPAPIVDHRAAVAAHRGLPPE
jgi:deoxyribodipyrimidine photo-lyase